MLQRFSTTTTTTATLPSANLCIIVCCNYHDCCHLNRNDPCVLNGYASYTCPGNNDPGYLNCPDTCSLHGDSGGVLSLSATGCTYAPTCTIGGTSYYCCCS
ncbi:unnamed protein product [Rotaria socialis]